MKEEMQVLNFVSDLNGAEMHFMIMKGSLEKYVIRFI
jgi:hypothetical protein